MTKKQWKLATLVVFGFIVCVAMQGNAGGPSVPNDVNIVAPSPDLPKNIAALSGKWAGTWKGGVDMILIVEEIHDTWATVVYCWGDSGSDANVKGGNGRQKCKVIADPNPKILWPALIKTRADVVFELKDPNTIGSSQNFYRGGGAFTITGTLKKSD